MVSLDHIRIASYNIHVKDASSSVLALLSLQNSVPNFVRINSIYIN